MQEFRWPRGAAAQLEVYSADHPQRLPTETYFADLVRKDIEDVRNGHQYVNLSLLIKSLEEIEEPGKAKKGFHTWLRAIEGVLGENSCREVGKKVCDEENFTIDEATSIYNGPYREKMARDHKLPKEATWEQINKQIDDLHKK